MIKNTINCVKVLWNSYKNYCESSRALCEVEIKIKNR